MQRQQSAARRRNGAAWRRFGTFSFATAFAPALWAQTSPAPAAGETQSLSPVVVTATRTERLLLDVPASVDVIDRETIRDGQLRVNLSETLSQVPGVVVLNRQNYAQDLQISMRGFGARSTFGVRGVRLYVDGVPATFPDGQGQVSHFPLNAAERIEVLRGPFSALYGNSSGGVILLTTDLKPQAMTFEPTAALGSNDTWRVGFSGKGGEQSNAFLVDANRFHTDGDRDHSAARRDSATVRTAFLDTPLGEVRISLNAVDMPESQDPMGLTRTELGQNPHMASPAALAFNTRKSTRQETLGGDIRSHFGSNASLTTTFWIGKRDITQYQSIPPTTQRPASGSVSHPGGVIDFDRVFGGTDIHASFALGPVTAHVGIDVEIFKEDRRGYLNFTGPAITPTEVGVKGDLSRDERNTITSIDPYLQADWKISEAWQAYGGVRASRVRFKSEDHFIAAPNNGDDSGSTSFSGVNPAAGIAFKPTQAMTTYFSYGRGFETPTLNELAYRVDASGTAIAGVNTDLRAARSNNFELGVKNLWTQGLRSTLALFTTRTHDEIVVRTNSGGRSTFYNPAPTRRDGIEAEVAWNPTQRLSLTTSASAINARYTESFVTCVGTPCVQVLAPAGNKIPGVPARTAFAGAKYKTPFADLSVEGRWQSKIYVNDPNSDQASAYAIASLAVARTFGVGSTKPRVFARLDNIFDRQYVGSVIVNEGNFRFFEPAPGRTWLIGIDWPL